MNKHFRAWDGEQYWYSDENFLFINDYKITDLQSATFNIQNIEMFTNKIDSQGVKIYENDLIINHHQDQAKIFQVTWSDTICGFRKVPHGMPLPETKIDEAFMQVIGTIHSKE